jgi:small subunit ribosomal protein S6
MRHYEIMFIVRPDVPDEDVDKLIAQMEGVVTSSASKVEKVEKMGRRRLAYRVHKHREGFYILFRLEGTGEMVKEFERRLKVADAVIRFLTVRIDEDLGRAEKFKALRAKQESKGRKAKPATPPVTPPATAEAAQA